MPSSDCMTFKVGGSLRSAHTHMTCCPVIGSLAVIFSSDYVAADRGHTHHTILHQQKPRAGLVSVLHLIMEAHKVSQEMMSKSLNSARCSPQTLWIWLKRCCWFRFQCGSRGGSIRKLRQPREVKRKDTAADQFLFVETRREWWMNLMNDEWVNDILGEWEHNEQ